MPVLVPDNVIAPWLAVALEITPANAVLLVSLIVSVTFPKAKELFVTVLERGPMLYVVDMPLGN